MTVEVADLNLLIFAIAFVVLGGWYLRANEDWYRAVRARDPSVHVDPFLQPLLWIRMAPRRLLQSPTELVPHDAVLQRLHKRMMQRLKASILLLFLTLLLSPWLLRVGGSIGTAALRNGIPSLAGGVAWTAILGYYSYRLLVGAYRYGNGQRVPATLFVTTVLAIVVTLLISGLMVRVG